MMLKRKIKGLFLQDGGTLNSKWIAYICQEDIKKVEKVMTQLEKEGFLK